MSKHEKVTEKLVGWLANFADREVDKLAQQNNININEFKNANYMENILDIVNRKKKTSVDEKVAKYREMVGLDLVDTLEKEGGKAVVASRISLSIRDKIAQDMGDGQKQLLDKVKQYIAQVVQNRNGAIVTPAIIDQLADYLKVDEEWLRNHYEEIKQMVEGAKEEFKPQTYNEVSVNDLARTDESSKDKEPPPFLPPSSSGA